MIGILNIKIISLLSMLVFMNFSCSGKTKLTEMADRVDNIHNPIVLSAFYKKSNNDAILINQLLEKAKIERKDFVLDLDVTIKSSIVIEGFDGFTFSFTNGAVLHQSGIPTSKQSKEIKNKFYNIFKIIDSQNITIADAMVKGDNPDGYILGLGHEVAFVSIKSSRTANKKVPKTKNIYILRPKVRNLIGSGVRSFAGGNAENIIISDGVFSNLAKTGINCNAEGLVVRNCTFEYCRGGLEIANSSHAIIDGNKISHCSNTGIAVGGSYKGTLRKDGSFSMDLKKNSLVGHGRQMGVKVINNTIYKCGGGIRSDSSNGPGISVTIGLTYPIIANNHVYFSGRSGIQVAQSPLPSNPVIMPLIHNNVLVSNGSDKSTGPNAGIYSDVPVMAHSNIIRAHTGEYDSYRQNYGIYIVTKYYKSPKITNEESIIYGNTIRSRGAIFMDSVSKIEMDEIMKKNFILKNK